MATTPSGRAPSTAPSWWRLGRASLRAGQGLWTIRRRFASLEASGRAAEIGRWSRALLADLGVAVAVDGAAPAEGPCLLLANHVSWLDVPVLHSVAPHARFISKAEVRHWPVLGALVDGAGTLFIERDRKRDALRVVHHVAERLRAGDTIAFFPEGTTGPGPTLKPFHGNLIEAALATATPIQFAVLRYEQPGEPFARAAAYIDDITLLTSARAVTAARGLRARVTLLPAEVPHGTRREVAERWRERAQRVLDAACPPR